MWLVYTPSLVLVFHAIWLVRFLGVIKHYSSVNNMCVPDKRKWLASSRELRATLNSFLRALVPYWSLQSCVYTHKTVLVLCRRVLVSSTLGKKYCQLIMTQKSNSNAKSLQHERTIGRKKIKSLKDEFGRIATALNSNEASWGSH